MENYIGAMEGYSKDIGKKVNSMEKELISMGKNKGKAFGMQGSKSNGRKVKCYNKINDV